MNASPALTGPPPPPVAPIALKSINPYKPKQASAGTINFLESIVGQTGPSLRKTETKEINWADIKNSDNIEFYSQVHVWLLLLSFFVEIDLYTLLSQMRNIRN